MQPGKEVLWTLELVNEPQEMKSELRKHGIISKLQSKNQKDKICAIAATHTGGCVYRMFLGKEEEEPEAGSASLIVTAHILEKVTSLVQV